MSNSQSPADLQAEAAEQQRIFLAARPLRVLRRPTECDERAGCWVEVGKPGCDYNTANHTPRCLACRGKIHVAASGSQRPYVRPAGITPFKASRL